MLYKKPKVYSNSSLKVNETYEGETIETKIERVMNNGEPITDGAPLIYTERKDGVGAQYNIRTDRFEVGIDGTDVITKTKIAQRENRMKVVKDESTGSENANNNSNNSGKTSENS